jgi:hypothetical protein
MTPIPAPGEVWGNEFEQREVVMIENGLVYYDEDTPDYRLPDSVTIEEWHSWSRDKQRIQPTGEAK